MPNFITVGSVRINAKHVESYETVTRTGDAWQTFAVRITMRSGRQYTVHNRTAEDVDDLLLRGGAA